MKMKAAVFHGPGDIRIEEMDRPKAEDGVDGNGMVLKVEACGICDIMDLIAGHLQTTIDFRCRSCGDFQTRSALCAAVLHDCFSAALCASRGGKLELLCKCPVLSNTFAGGGIT